MIMKEYVLEEITMHRNRVNDLTSYECFSTSINSDGSEVTRDSPPDSA